MSKIAQYLNEHILGEATSAEAVRKRFSRDGSILNITPELVIHPRVTNDIRKVARFTWQLAEKGHAMPITARGSGSDQTGAAIGKGIIINTLAHLNKIIFINPKNNDQFVHTQPGVRFGALNETLKSHGMHIPSAPPTAAYSTIGGAVANNSGGIASGTGGQTGDWVTRMEVVLANGDLIETSRISRRDLNKKKGLQTFEGEIYRKIDGIIEDNQQLINDEIDKDSIDNNGYPGIAQVKRRDGSFDLTPLFIGSQGTLGIISEIVLKAAFYSNDESIVVAVFDEPEIARDAADLMVSLQPESIEIIDGEYYDIARKHGKKYPFFGADPHKSVGAVLYVSFNDFSDHARKRKVKKALKKMSKMKTTIFTNDDQTIEELHAIREVSSVILRPESKEESYPPLIDGASVLVDRREEFILAVQELAKKHHISLPLHIQWLGGIVHARPMINLHNMTDRQKTFKLISDYAELVAKFGGCISTESGEGRLRASAAYANINNDLLEVYKQIRAAFDPFGTMNPGVKQESDLKTLIAQLNTDYNQADFAQYSPHD